MADPRIVLFDLETLPNLTEVMKVLPSLSDYPGRTLKAQLNSVICAGWKVFGESKVHCINAWDFSTWNKSVNDDKQIVSAIRDVLAEADAVVTHNGKKFDWKFLQTRLLLHGLRPLPKTPHIDTCAVAKAHLFMHNNRLKNLAEYLTLERKQENEGWPLWERVMRREARALSEMSKYCKQDVLALEALFKRLRPFVTNLPNHNLFNPMKEKVCHACGSTRLKIEGKRYSQTRGPYTRRYCIDCGSPNHTDAKDQLPRPL